MDRGALWATVHRIAESQTRLKRLSAREHLLSIAVQAILPIDSWYESHQGKPSNVKNWMKQVGLLREETEQDELL